MASVWGGGMSTDMKTIFAQRLKMRRTQLGMTMEQLAHECDVFFRTVYEWERGEWTPTVDNLIKIAKYLDVSIGWLFGEVETLSPVPEERKVYRVFMADESIRSLLGPKVKDLMKNGPMKAKTVSEKLNVDRRAALRIMNVLGYQSKMHGTSKWFYENETDMVTISKPENVTTKAPKVKRDENYFKDLIESRKNWKLAL